MSGPGLPTNIDTSYADSVSDTSVQLHQQHHDTIGRMLNRFEDEIPATAGMVPTWNGSTYAAATPSSGGAGGGGTSSVAVIVASSDMSTAVKAAADFVCDATNDEVQIQAAIDLAAGLVARNSNSPGGAAQRGTVQLTGGAFIISAPIQMRAGVRLVGMGEQTELRAVSLSSTAGYPSGVAAVIKQVSVNDHAMWVSNLWINGNFAAGGSCHGLVFSGPGSSGADGTYPAHGSDPSNQVHDLFISGMSNATRHGIWLTNGCRAGHYSNLMIRDCTGSGANAFWADATPDSVLSDSTIGPCDTGVRLEGGNWRVHGVKTFYANAYGFYIGSGRSVLADIESQDDQTGIYLASAGLVLAGVTVDSANTDALVIAANRISVAALQVFARAAARFTASGTPVNGIRFSGTPTDVQLVGYVTQAAGAAITNPFVGVSTGARNFIRVSDDTLTTVRAVG
jgi:hypothetical protein